MSSLYPIAVNINGRKCLLVGGGKIAERKALTLLESGAQVTIVSPQLTPLLSGLASEKNIKYTARNFIPGDTAGFFLVVCATDDEETNQMVARECFAGDRLVNVVDDPPKCSFFVPAIVKRGSLLLAISTSGKSPLLSAKIKKMLEKEFAAGWEDVLELLGQIREAVLKEESDPAERRKLFDSMLDDNTFYLLKQQKYQEAKERILNAYHCNRFKS